MFIRAYPIFLLAYVLYDWYNQPVINSSASTLCKVFSMDCHNHISAEVLEPPYAQVNWLYILFTIFITGLSGSFTHCISMCGPIAMSQMSMRLMRVTSSRLDELQKLRCAAAIPYYVGKALTYSILAIAAELLTAPFRTYSIFQVLWIIMLFFAALFFIKLGITRFLAFVPYTPSRKPWYIKLYSSKIVLLRYNLMRKLNIRLINIVSNFNLNPYGLRGLALGMILGFIPCGLVYATISILIANTNSLLLILVGMLSFGLGTIPGLFLISYLGTHVLTRYKKIFTLFYIVTMLFNSYLLLSYIIKFF